MGKKKWFFGSQEPRRPERTGWVGGGGREDQRSMTRETARCDKAADVGRGSWAP